MNMQRHASLALGSGLAGTIAAILMAVLFGLQPVQATAAQALSAPATIVAHGEHTDTVATAAVVVDLGDGAAVVRWVDLAAPLSGLEVLEASGLDVAVAESSFGPAVCAIEQVGCPVDNCFCDADNYWNYSFWDGSAWQPYPVGANDAIVEADGAIEGWRWGAFDGGQASPVRAIAAASALEWLRTQQDPAGGYGESVSGALEALMAVGANRHPASTWRAADDAASAEDFLRRMGRRFAGDGAAAAGKLAVALAGAGACRPARLPTPLDFLDADAGVFAPDSGFNAWGILGTAALSQTIPATAVDALAVQQQDNGGWEWQAGFGADTNTTALAVQALIAAGGDPADPAITAALAFFDDAQQPDGGFVYDPATPEYGSDANSTAYVVQALVAAGEDPAGERWSAAGATPYDFLLSLQQPDGSFVWQPGTPANLVTTAQVVPALLGRPYPLAVRALELCTYR
jgi:hypothetical protein